jgi:putative heme-binding domain-containing protein
MPGKGMPPFAALGNEKLNAILKYLRTLQGSRATMPVAGDAALGKKLFYGKASCAKCHMVTGSGGFLGPELSSYAQGHSGAEIRSVIIHPETNPGPRQTAAKLLTKDGHQYEGVIRNEDNFSVQLQSADGAFHLLVKTDVAAVDYRSESLMPADYGSTLSAAELDALVAYLVRVAHEKGRAGDATETPAPEDEL